jgi:hypothetical protein
VLKNSGPSRFGPLPRNDDSNGAGALNLEASVRSRHDWLRIAKGDLIEAGLSEAAGWRAWLWGLWPWPVARARAPAEAWADVGRLIAIGEDDCGR